LLTYVLSNIPNDVGLFAVVGKNTHEERGSPIGQLNGTQIAFAGSGTRMPQFDHMLTKEHDLDQEK
jgi:hypothetical protein